MERTTVTEVEGAARALLRQQRPGVAADRLREFLAADEAHPELWEMLGIACAVAGDRPGARRAFEKCTLLQPQRASAHYNFAIHLSMAGELDEAAERNAAALYLDPGHSGAQALQKQLATRIRERERTSELGFAVVAAAPGLSSPSDAFARLECPICHGMNLVTARVCRRCTNRLPDSIPVVAME